MSMSASGMSASLPALMGTRPEERDRLLRRMEHNAKATARAAKIEGHLSVKRAERKENIYREFSQSRRALLDSQAERVVRWTDKLQDSPLHVDLWAEDEKMYKWNQKNNRIQMQKRTLADIRQREAYDTIQRKATSEKDELSELREERRQHVLNMKAIKALKDVQRSAARTAQVLEDRNKKELERQQLQLARAMSDPNLR
eukprot:TRINITY_DN82063_c0_g1_i1.p1 TRINITY_DN82063_c0_g1~~TRINITY_DN82063_c0_g1_i1.p1  ORF type:complete len:200 (-),score=45.44 TRINITY_DN82063_c0_g1_i1:178-777(-)